MEYQMSISWAHSKLKKTYQNQNLQFVLRDPVCNFIPTLVIGQESYCFEWI